eukprot:SAG22_NODE_484_length_9912_cov_23.425150_6_plen_299_part_00
MSAAAGSKWPKGAPRMHGSPSIAAASSERLLPADDGAPASNSTAPLGAYVDVDADEAAAGGKGKAQGATLLAPEYKPPFLCRPCHFVKAECNTAFDFVKDLSKVFSGGFILYCVSTYLCIKGSVASFIGLGQLPYYREMGLSAAQYQIYVSVSTTPWSMKALYGLLSDTLSCCGYRKRGYIIFCSTIAVAVFAVLAAVPFEEETAVIAAILFFFGSVDVALVDLLVQGKYAELMVKHPATSSSLVSWVWGNYHIGALGACDGWRLRLRLPLPLLLPAAPPRAVVLFRYDSLPICLARG